MLRIMQLTDRVPILRGLLCAATGRSRSWVLPLSPSPFSFSGLGTTSGSPTAATWSTSAMSCCCRHVFPTSRLFRENCFLEASEQSGGKVFTRRLSSRTLAVRPSRLPCQAVKPLSQADRRASTPGLWNASYLTTSVSVGGSTVTSGTLCG